MIPVIGVVTVPDRPSGRGLTLRQSPVKTYALSHSLPLLQPARLKSRDFMAAVEALDPDLQVVVAFRMLPREIWGMPPLGTFNLHASLLPQYRGAAPIHRAIMNGEILTGVTTFLINDIIDTGSILLQRARKIGPDETAGQLHDALKVIGAELVVQTVREVCSGNLVPRPQISTSGPGLLHTAPKLSRQDTIVNWHLDTLRVYNQIRGLNPHPGAGTELPLKDGTVLPVKLGLVSPLPSLQAESDKPGKVITDFKHSLQIATMDGYIDVLEIQPASKKLMKINDFLNGYGSQLS